MLFEKPGEDFLCFIELLLPQIGEGERYRGVAVFRCQALRLEKLKLCRVEPVHAEVKLAQQLPRLCVHGLLRQKGAHCIHALLKLAFTEVDHGQTEQSCVGISDGFRCILVCRLGLIPIRERAVSVAQLL